jgi:uncharacterized protein YecT (DUF1311 family)
MKKKLKSLLQGDQPTGDKEIDRLKKAYEAAKTKLKKAKSAKSDAKKALKKSLSQWLSQQDAQPAPAGKAEKPKANQPLKAAKPVLEGAGRKKG